VDAGRPLAGPNAQTRLGAKAGRAESSCGRGLWRQSEQSAIGPSRLARCSLSHAEQRAQKRRGAVL
jgi:hypothetical protein